MKNLLLSVCLLVKIIQSCFAGPQIDVIEYYGTSFRIPAPEGFVRFDKTYPQVAEPIRRQMGISSDLLCAYGREQEILARKTGKVSHFKILFEATAASGMRSVNVTPVLFGHIKDVFKVNAFDAYGVDPQHIADKEAEAVNNYLQKEQHSTDALKIIQPHLIDKFDNRLNSICLTAVAKLEITMHEKREEFVALSVLSAMNLHRRAIFITCVGDYDGAETIKTFKSAVTTWRDQIIELNPEEPSGS
ncbi:MAG: hypothetical protein JO347_11580 [Candidatus Eremiobacteraeota bacterium]|nr:hypothetical protein [Candidatus Eremiobacteraeota bacterium]